MAEEARGERGATSRVNGRNESQKQPNGEPRERACEEAAREAGRLVLEKEAEDHRAAQSRHQRIIKYLIAFQAFR